MSVPVDGIDYLDMLREKSGEKGRRFDDLSWYLELRAREQGVPIHGQFELTPLCNFDCKMCYTHLTKQQMKGRPLLSAEEWKGLIHDAWKAGMYIATLTGGECLTYPGFEDIYLYLHSLGCEVHVLSNGMLMDEHWISFFKKHTPASIQITLYGHDDDSYESVTGKRVFKTVSKNIELIQEANLPLKIAITPNKYLGDAIYDTIRLAKKWTDNVEINSSLFDPREETGRAGRNADLSIDDYIKIYRLIQELDGVETREIPPRELPEPGGPVNECSSIKGLRCGGGRSGFIIDWKGRMIPCNEFYTIEALPLRDGFEQAWKKINKVCSEWPRVAECEECPYVSVCRTCAAGMLRYAKPGIRPIELCNQTRTLVQHGVWHIPDCD